MVQRIKGNLWWCCPECGKKLHILSADAVCHGVITKCKQCGWEGPIELKKEAG